MPRVSHSSTPQAVRRQEHSATASISQLHVPAEDQTHESTPSSGSNPLWAINVGMGVFFGMAALLLALG